MRMLVVSSRKKRILTEFALMLRYEIDISFERKLSSECLIHTVKISFPGRSNSRM